MNLDSSISSRDTCNVNQQGDTDKPLVSVVMSVFNGEPFLRESVESILGQSFRDFEFIIIDDGSTDATALILDSYVRSDPRVQVYHQGNRGLVESLNRGCRVARGKYIARMDADDIALKDRLTWQVEFLKHRPEVALVGGGMYVIGKAGSPCRTILFPEDNATIQERLPRSWCIAHPTVMLRTDVFRALGGYRAGLRAAEDYDLWLRIAEQHQLANLRRPLIYYRVHPEQVCLTGIEEQAVSTLAVRAAARRRAAGGRDPLDHVKQITPQTLAALGVTKDALADGIAQQYIFAAANSLAAGYPAHSRRVLEQAAVSCRSHRASRAVMGELHWLSAKVHLRNREVTRALVCALQACRLKPFLATKPLTYPFRHAVSVELVSKVKAMLAITRKKEAAIQG